MNVIYCKVGCPPEVKEIDGSLRSMQDLVGGYIEAIYLGDGGVLVCNENGKIDGSLPNRFAYDVRNGIIDMIFGDFFIAGDGEEDFDGLTDAQMKRYLERYSEWL